MAAPLPAPRGERATRAAPEPLRAPRRPPPPRRPTLVPPPGSSLPLHGMLPAPQNWKRPPDISAGPPSQCMLPPVPPACCCCWRRCCWRSRRTAAPCRCAQQRGWHIKRMLGLWRSALLPTSAAHQLVPAPAPHWTQEGLVAPAPEAAAAAPAPSAPAPSGAALPPSSYDAVSVDTGLIAYDYPRESQCWATHGRQCNEICIRQHGGDVAANAVCFKPCKLWWPPWPAFVRRAHMLCTCCTENGSSSMPPR